MVFLRILCILYILCILFIRNIITKYDTFNYIYRSESHNNDNFLYIILEGIILILRLFLMVSKRIFMSLISVVIV